MFYSCLSVHREVGFPACIIGHMTSIPGWWCVQGVFASRGTVGRPPPELEKWAVGILLSCDAFLFSLTFVSLIFNMNIN